MVGTRTRVWKSAGAGRGRPPRAAGPERMPGSAERGPRFLRPPRPRVGRPLRGRCFLLLCPRGAGNSLPRAAAREQCAASCRPAGPRPRSRSPPWAAGKWPEPGRPRRYSGSRPGRRQRPGGAWCRPRATGRGGGDPALARRQLVHVCHLHVHRARHLSARVRACATLSR